MSYDGGKLGLIVDRGQQTAGDVDESPRQREGVHRSIIHDVKFPGKIGTFRCHGHALAEGGHVRIELGILVQTDALGHILGSLLSHLNFLRFRDQRELALARDRVPGAAQGPEHDGAEHERTAVSQRYESGAWSHGASLVLVLWPDLVMNDRLSTGPSGSMVRRSAGRGCDPRPPLQEADLNPQRAQGTVIPAVGSAMKRPAMTPMTIKSRMAARMITAV